MSLEKLKPEAKGTSTDENFVKNQSRELKKFRKAHPSSSGYEDLSRRLLRAHERQASSTTPEELDVLIEDINRTIAEHLDKEVQAAVAETDTAIAKQKVVNVGVRLSKLKGPIEAHMSQIGDPDKKQPSRLKLDENDKKAILGTAENLSDSLYGIPAEVAPNPTFNLADLPPGIDQARFTYLIDRMQHVVDGRGVLGFHRYDELQEVLGQLEKAGTHAELHAQLAEMVTRIPSMEMENLFADVLPRAKYWQGKESVPKEESAVRMSDRGLRDAFTETFYQWRDRRGLTEELRELNARRERQLHNAFGTVRAEGLMHTEHPDVPLFA